MKKKIILSIAISFIVVIGAAQQLPIGTCGIVNVYDAAGNRTKRVYFCNNGIDPYPNAVQTSGEEAAMNEEKINPENAKDQAFQYVDALSPNPTTGKFSVTFSKSLLNASVGILDNNGKVIVQFKANGYKVDFDLSPYAAGMYFIRIEENGKAITKKVVKQ